MDKVRSDKEWSQIIRAWDTSGKSQREYCRQRGVSFWVFRNRRAKQQVSQKAKEDCLTPSFVEVRKQSLAFSGQPARIRIIHKTGMCIEFEHDTEPDRIRSVVQAVFAL